MTLFRNTAEGGTNGVAASVGNSGGTSGDAFTAVAGLTVSNAQAMRGTLSYASPATAAAGLGRWAVSGSSLAARMYLWIASSTTSDQGLMQFSHTTDVTSATAYLNAAGALRLSTKGVTNSWTAGATFPTAQWVRVEMYATIGTTTSNGTVRVAYFLGDSTTAVYDSGTLTGLNLGGDLGTFTQVRLGKSSTLTSPQFYFDDMAVNTSTDATGLIGPPANAAPVINSITANQNLAAGVTATVAVSAADGDGSIASYAWSVVSAGSTSTPTLTGSTTNTITFTVPAAGNVVKVQCIVTDNLGATATSSTEVRVPKTGAFTTLSLAGIGSWTNTGGAANVGAALADASDTTYVESPDYTSTESEQRWRLEPLASRSTLQLVYGNQVTATGGTKKFRLYEANTLRQEWTCTQHTSISDDTFNVTAPAAISDWGNLWVAEAVTT